MLGILSLIGRMEPVMGSVEEVVVGLVEEVDSETGGMTDDWISTPPSLR